MSNERLFDAIRADDYARVKDALEKGADVNTRYDNSWTPLMHAACVSSTPEIVRLLLEKDAEVDARSDADFTPLTFAAARSTRPEIVRLLLAAGSEVDARDEEGGTPLMMAARFSTTPEIVSMLLAAGAEIEARDNLGQTPLMCAGSKGSLPLLRMLLEAKAEVDAVDPGTGFTAFHATCGNGHPDCAEALVRAGCDTGLRTTKHGVTGREIAKEKGHTAVLERLAAIKKTETNRKKKEEDQGTSKRGRDRTKEAEVGHGLSSCSCVWRIATG